MGLNLKERSSGRWQGQLKITKRGSSQVRRWLYFAALRLIKRDQVQPWYVNKQRRRPNDAVERMRAIVGVMRKLALALYQVGVHQERFDAALLFPEALKSVREAARAEELVDVPSGVAPLVAEVFNSSHRTRTSFMVAPGRATAIIQPRARLLNAAGAGASEVI